MRYSVQWVRAIVLAAFAVVACGDAAIFTCTDDGSCGASGRCEMNGSCSFPDATCPSGRRYGEHAPLDIAGHCVDDGLAGTTSTGAQPSTTNTDATTGDATTDDATMGPTTLASSSGDASESTGREPTSTTMPSTSSVDDATSTGDDPQPIVIGPLSIADDFDDGAMWPTLMMGMEDGAWLPSGEIMAGFAYCGEHPVDHHYYAYFRFVLPEPIPDGAVVVSASLEVDGHGVYQWDAMTHALRIWAQHDPNPEQVVGLESYPSPQQLTDTSVRWPAVGGLAWNVMGPNASPDLAPVVQTVVDAFGGIAQGGAIQLWIGADQLGRQGHEVGWIDASHPDREPARLTLTILRP